MSEGLPLDDWSLHNDRPQNQFLFTRTEQSASFDVDIFLPREQKDAEHLELFQSLLMEQGRAEQQEATLEADCLSCMKVSEESAECEIATNSHPPPAPKQKKIGKQKKDPIFLEPTPAKKKGKAGRPPKNSQKSPNIQIPPKQKNIKSANKSCNEQSQTPQQPFSLQAKEQQYKSCQNFNYECYLDLQ